MDGLLDGLRVIDFGRFIAGPLTGMLLADQGADVIRIDEPGTSRAQSATSEVWNRGKRSIVLDLAADHDLDVAKTLIASADVVIENFRPGVMRRFGLGPDEMLARNGRLVYCSLPGFASDDPRAQTPAWEGVLGAATALYGTAGRPVYGEVPTSSFFGALLGATSIMMALAARDRDGSGQYVEVPLYDATFHSLLVTLLFAGAQDSAGVHAGVMAPFWSLDRAHAFRGQYECSDGGFIDMTVHSARTLAAFLDVAGTQNWIEEGLITPDMEVASGKDTELVELVRQTMKSRPVEWWNTELGDRGVGVAPCHSPREWLHHEHARASGAVVEVAGTTFGTMLQPGPLVRTSPEPPTVQRAHRADEDRTEILDEIASGEPDQSHSVSPGSDRTSRPPLDGIRVIDMSLLLAGPSCGCLLAEFGAEVIKINEPSGFHGGRGGFADRDRGKKSITVDLQTQEGREIFWKLAEDADVLLQNWRPGVAERLGLGYEQVHARLPHLIYASDCAFGEAGPWHHRGGYEYQAQAVAGLEHRYGGGQRPTIQPVPVVDLGTGIGLTLAVGLGLYHRSRTGEGVSVFTALVFTATTAGSTFLYDYEGREWDDGPGQTMLGTGPLHRMYEASDRWVFMGARREDIAVIRGICGLDVTTADEALEAELEKAFLQKSAQEWVDLLTAADIGAHVVLSPRDLVEDEIAKGRDLIWPTVIANLGPTLTSGVAPRLSRTPVLRHLPTRKPGEDSLEVLGQIGMAEKFDRLRQGGVVLVDTAGPFAF